MRQRSFVNDPHLATYPFPYRFPAAPARPRGGVYARSHAGRAIAVPLETDRGADVDPARSRGQTEAFYAGATSRARRQGAA
jgi:hypothetical protein